MEVTTVACLKDNYAYLVRESGAKLAAVVDPSEAAPVLAALSRLDLKLGAILTTHHHVDHVGGNHELVERFPGIDVFGSARDRGRIPAQTRFLEDGETIDVLDLRFRCVLIPGHTLGAVGYVGHGAVFTGDTLFAAGCGRLFEGTPAMMYDSLNVKLGMLPDATLVYCGHEYTASNLRFAAHVEPGNADVKAKAERVEALRARGEPTVPSTIGEERKTNPFLRCDSQEILASVAGRLGESRAPEAAFGAIRAEKDAF